LPRSFQHQWSAVCPSPPLHLLFPDIQAVSPIGSSPRTLKILAMVHAVCVIASHDHITQNYCTKARKSLKLRSMSLEVWLRIRGPPEEHQSSSSSFDLHAFVRYGPWAEDLTLLSASPRPSPPFPTRKARGCKCLEQVAAFFCRPSPYRSRTFRFDEFSIIKNTPRAVAVWPYSLPLCVFWTNG
jgi:hypothetical protein